MINNIEFAKRRLMFSTVEDSYFLTYNIILILGLLNCIDKKYLKDLNKIALLITILEKRQNIDVTRKVLEESKISYSDKAVLFDMYYSSKLRIRSVTSIIFTLDKKGLVSLRRNGKTIDIALVNRELYDKFIKENIFQDDIKVYNEVFMVVNKIKNIVSDTFNKKIFESIKEEIWDI